MAVRVAAILALVVLAGIVRAGEESRADRVALREAVPLPAWFLEFTFEVEVPLEVWGDGLQESSAEALEARLVAHPEDDEARLALARERADQGEVATARALRRAVATRAGEAVAADPSDLAAWRLLARAKGGMGDHAEATRILRWIVERPEAGEQDRRRYVLGANHMAGRLLGWAPRSVLDTLSFESLAAPVDPASRKEAADLLASVRPHLARLRDDAAAGGQASLAPFLAYTTAVWHALTLAAEHEGPAPADAAAEALAAIERTLTIWSDVAPDAIEPLWWRMNALIKAGAATSWSPDVEARLERVREAIARVAAGESAAANRAAGLLAMLPLLREDAESAEEAARRCLLVHPDNTMARLVLVTVLRGKHRHEEIVEVARAWVDTAPSIDARWVLAKGLALVGDTAGAETEAERLLAEDPESPEVHLLVAALAMRGGDDATRRQRARRHLETARSLLAELIQEADTLLALGQLEASLLALEGREEEARARLRVLLRWDPANEEGAALLEALGAVGEAPILAKVGDGTIRDEDVLAELGTPTLLMEPDALAAARAEHLVEMVQLSLLAGMGLDAGVLLAEDDVEDLLRRDLGVLPSTNAGWVEWTGRDGLTVRRMAERTMLAYAWSWGELGVLETFEVRDGAIVVPDAHLQSLVQGRPELWEVPRRVRATLWSLPYRHFHESRWEAGGTTRTERRREVRRAAEEGAALLVDDIHADPAFDGGALARLHGLSLWEVDTSEDDASFEEQAGPEVAAWLNDPERKPGDTHVFELDDGLLVAAVQAVIAPMRLDYGTGRQSVGARLVEAHRRDLQLEAVEIACAEPGRVRPADLAARVRDASRAERQALRDSDLPLPPLDDVERTQLPLAVFTSLDDARTEAEQTDCPLILFLPDPSADAGDPGVDAATLERLASTYVVVVAEGPEAAALRVRYGVGGDGPQALAFFANGAVAARDLPLEPSRLLEALHEAVVPR